MEQARFCHRLSLWQRQAHERSSYSAFDDQRKEWEAVMRRLATICATVLFLASASALAQQVKVTMLVSEAPVTGVPDKVFTLITTEWPPGVSTGRHTHPGDEYGTVVEGTVVTRQDGGEWKTLTTGQSYYVPAGVVHETKNTGDSSAKAYNAFVIEKGKPRVTPVP
jgi:quercetin dioxygenase-like cupin family protein